MRWKDYPQPVVNVRNSRAFELIRILSAVPVNPLIQQGWERQVTLDEPRLSEVVEMYREIGFDVRIAPFDPDSESGCMECMQSSAERYQTIYTRRRNSDVSDS
jgi:hypothetical protein